MLTKSCQLVLIKFKLIVLNLPMVNSVRFFHFFIFLLCLIRYGSWLYSIVRRNGLGDSHWFHSTNVDYGCRSSRRVGHWNANKIRNTTIKTTHYSRCTIIVFFRKFRTFSETQLFHDIVLQSAVSVTRWFPREFNTLRNILQSNYHCLSSLS